MVVHFATPQLTDGPTAFHATVSTRRAADVLQQFQSRIDLTDHPIRWNHEQRQKLVLTWLLGLQVGPMMISEDTTRSEITILDGRERFATLTAWHAGQLDTPTAWWPQDWITARDSTAAVSVRYSDLTDLGRRRICDRWMLTVNRVHGTGDLGSIRNLLNSTRV